MLCSKIGEGIGANKTKKKNHEYTHMLLKFHVM